MVETPSDQPMERPSTRRIFNRRPLCVAAVGVLFGTLCARAIPPPDCFSVTAVLLLVSAAAMWTGRRGFALLALCAAIAALSAGLRYPKDGAFPMTGSVLELPGSALSTELQLLRARLLERIGLLFPRYGGVAKGMLLGDKGDIARDTLDSFQSVGVMHLLAISGLHVSILASALALVLRRGAWTRCIVVTLFLFVYAALTAFSPSVMRAGVMYACGLLAFPLRRRADPPSTLSAAFILILLFNPLALYYAGFQLSFCAVYGLVLLAPVFQRPLRRLGSAASGLIAASLAVTVATVPAMALAFSRVQLTSLVTNLFVLPLVPAFLIPAFLGVGLSFLSMPLGNAVAAVSRVALDVLVAFAQAGGAADIALPPPSAASYLLFLAALPFLSPLCLLKKETRYCIFLSCLLLAALLWRA